MRKFFNFLEKYYLKIKNEFNRVILKYQEQNHRILWETLGIIERQHAYLDQIGKGEQADIFVQFSVAGRIFKQGEK